MTSEQIRGQDTVLAPLARWARGRLDELVQVAYERILERIEPYRTAGLVPARRCVARCDRTWSSCSTRSPTPTRPSTRPCPPGPGGSGRARGCRSRRCSAPTGSASRSSGRRSSPKRPRVTPGAPTTRPVRPVPCSRTSGGSGSSPTGTPSRSPRATARRPHRSCSPTSSAARPSSRRCSPGSPAPAPRRGRLPGCSASRPMRGSSSSPRRPAASPKRACRGSRRPSPPAASSRAGG